MYVNQHELSRLILAFEVEAALFHDLRFTRYWLTQSLPVCDRKFDQSNHMIRLWQYFGLIERKKVAETLKKSIQTSDFQWGLRGAEITSFGLIEGDTTDKFVRMAKRCAALFDKKTREELCSKTVKEICHEEKEGYLPIASTNSDPLAIWLNYLLYHLSLTDPGSEKNEQISPDPYTLSLLALERIKDEATIGKSDRSYSDVTELVFHVALSFTGEKRRVVSKVADHLRDHWGKDSLFYDFDYQAQLSRANLDLLLQDIYSNRARLIVVFLSEEYQSKEWCGLEWRAIRDLIKRREDSKVMFVKLEDFRLDGLFSGDGYLDATKLTPRRIADFIIERAADPKLRA
ncbi:MAG: TIR domain-containing protein [Verrucomicrobiota bacterium]